MTHRRLNSCVLAACLPIVLLTQAALAGPIPPTNQLFGFISSNRTLTSSHPGPVYDVLGDLVVMPGVTLTVQPGVTLRMAANDILQGGDYFSQVELEVRGHLQADASFGDSIRILEAVSGSLWGQIKIAGAGTATLQNVVISGASQGLVAASTSPVSIRHSSIRSCLHGVRGGWSAPFVVEACQVSGRDAWIGSGQGLAIGPATSLTSTMPSEPQPSSISGFFYGVYFDSAVPLVNLIVRDNYIGLVISAGEAATVNYCTIVRNTGTAIALGGAATNSVLNSIVAQNPGGNHGFTISYSDFWQNGSYSGVTFGPQIAGFNPFFIDPANNDFRLAENSIFKGYSSSGGEIGAFGPGAGLPTSRAHTTWGRLKSLYK